MENGAVVIPPGQTIHPFLDEVRPRRGGKSQRRLQRIPGRVSRWQPGEETPPAGCLCRATSAFRRACDCDRGRLHLLPIDPGGRHDGIPIDDEEPFAPGRGRAALAGLRRRDRLLGDEDHGAGKPAAKRLGERGIGEPRHDKLTPTALDRPLGHGQRRIDRTTVAGGTQNDRNVDRIGRHR